MFSGVLEPPSDIQVVFHWWPPLTLQVDLSWEQPFTLNITNPSSVCNTILYYEVIFRSLWTSTTKTINTSDTQLTYNLSVNSAQSKDDNTCNDNSTWMVIQISAINRVGASNRSKPVYLRDLLNCTSGRHKHYINY